MASRYDSDELREQRKRAYVEALRQCGEVGPSARRAGVSRSTILKWRDQDPEFEEACLEAKADADDDAVTEMRERGMGRVKEPVMINGRQVYEHNPDGTPKLDDDFERVPVMRSVRSDHLLERYVRANVPRFRDNARVELTGPNGVPLSPIEIVFVEAAGGRPLDPLGLGEGRVIEHRPDPLED